MSYISKHEIGELERRIGYRFKDSKLLLNALTHSSYANESPNNISDNERLEFLGDSVLELVIADYLYGMFGQYKEGDLTRIRASIVSEGSLAEIARSIELGQFLYLGKGESNTGGRDRSSVLADAVEAIIGAVYVDSGIKQASEFIIRLFTPIMKKSFEGKGFQDYKTNLQEVLQKDSDKDIVYRVIEERGPDHNKDFVVEVCHGDKAIGRGRGKNKKEAEQHAAKEALGKING
ncbi:MAG: ribonuclease III [Clostridiales bacterium]|nr:ribonuclease III [Clostridiales bacterium]